MLPGQTACLLAVNYSPFSSILPQLSFGAASLSEAAVKPLWSGAATCLEYSGQLTWCLVYWNWRTHESLCLVSVPPPQNMGLFWSEQQQKKCKKKKKMKTKNPKLFFEGDFLLGEMLAEKSPVRVYSTAVAVTEMGCGLACCHLFRG